MFSRIHIATLQDLGVYVGQNLTSPVRYCGGLGFFSARAERQCLESLGFSPECLSIWLDNMHNTKKVCFWVSLLEKRDNHYGLGTIHKNVHNDGGGGLDDG